MVISITPIQPDDFADWTRLFNGYLEYYETDLSDQTKMITFKRLLDPTTKIHGRLAWHDDAPVGLVHYLYHDHTWHPEGVCYLQDLFADPAQRGKGIGYALIQTVYQAADAAGVPSVYWTTQDFNKTARVLYDRVARKTPFIKYQRR